MTVESATAPSASLTTSPLSGRGILSIQGPDSRRFLQGQSTADIQGLQAEQWTLAGFCTPKGRLYANGYLVAVADDHYWLILPVDMVTETLTRLQKYAAFFKTELIDASKHWHGLACLHSTPLTPSLLAGQVSADSQKVIMGMPGGHQLIWLNPLEETGYEQVLEKVEQAECVPESNWDAIEIQQGLAWIVPETCEAFLPQALAWDDLGGVSYKKGCYTGQEVVARLHYKGASKKQLRHIRGTGSPPATGASLYSSADKVTGTVVRASAVDKNWGGLAVVNVVSADSEEAERVLSDNRTATLDAWVVPTNKES